MGLSNAAITCMRGTTRRSALRDSRVIVHALVLFVLFAATGCGTRFIYNQLDWFIVWRIQDVVPLTAEQEQTLRFSVEENLEWARRTQMPRYASFLRTVADDAQNGTTTEIMEQRYSEMLLFWDEFMLHIIPDVQILLADLSQEQIDEMFENLEESNQELYDEYSGRSEEERARNRDRAALRGVRRFTGKLSDEQEVLITGSLERMEDASEDWIGNRREWQARFRELLESSLSEEEFRLQLTVLFVYPRRNHGEDYRRRVDSNLATFNEMMVELIDSLDEKQREKMVRRLTGFAEALEKLSLDKR